MKALQDKGIAKERVITHLYKRIKNLTDGQEQYKGAFWTLNQEVKELRLEEEGCQKKKEQKAKEAMEKELTALLGQVEMAKADVVKEFKASQTFIDSCAEYYGVGFKDCLKKVKSIYPHLDLSKVSIDDPFLSTPAEETLFLKRVMTSPSLRWIQRMIVSFLPNLLWTNSSFLWTRRPTL